MPNVMSCRYLAVADYAKLLSFYCASQRSGSALFFIIKKDTRKTECLNHNQINMKNYYLRKLSFLMMAR